MTSEGTVVAFDMIATKMYPLGACAAVICVAAKLRSRRVDAGMAVVVASVPCTISAGVAVVVPA